MVKQKHISQLDFIKGVAIVAVILLHALGHVNEQIYGQYHIGQAVPLFILISCYLGFLSLSQKGVVLNDYFSYNKIVKMLKRIFIPFLIAQIVIIGCLLVNGHFVSVLQVVKTILKLGGFGPGSYYPYLYLQLWILLPVFCNLLIFSRLRKWGGDSINYFNIG